MNIFFATLLFTTSYAEEIERLTTETMQVGSKSIEVEIADELHERQRGLMYRKTMDVDHGMLFVYPEAEPRSFWMKNTYIPLSIAYIDTDCLIVHIAKMMPLTTKGVPSIYPAQYVLEMNQGWFEENGIKIGESIKGVQHCP